MKMETSQNELCKKCQKERAIGKPKSLSGLCFKCGEDLLAERREERINAIRQNMKNRTQFYGG